MKIHLIEGHGFSGNIFLIDAEKPCLIDTGADADISFCSEEVRALLGKRKLEHIILTHRHIDHIGGALAFYAEFGGDIYAHEDDADSLITGDQISTGATLFGGHVDPIPLTKLSEGDEIDLGGGDKLIVVHTPGHTIGSMCLLGQKHLFSGDTVFAQGGVGRWDLETGDYPQLLESVKKLASMDFANLYPGHGPCVEGNAKEHLALSLKYLSLIGRYD